MLRNPSRAHERVADHEQNARQRIQARVDRRQVVQRHSRSAIIAAHINGRYVIDPKNSRRAAASVRRLEKSAARTMKHAPKMIATTRYAVPEMPTNAGRRLTGR